MRDQFIAGLTSNVRVNFIGKGHKHKDTAQTKVKLREVVEVAKTFEATMVANQLMKTARDTQQEQVNAQQEQVNFTSKLTSVNPRQEQQFSQCFWCGGNHQQPRQSHCPAFGKRCAKCGITGHFARACKGGSRRRQGRQQQSNFVDDDNGEEAFVADCETPPQLARKYFAHLHLIQGGKTKVVKAQMDSASTCNTIPSSLLSQLFPDVKISRTKSKINTYGTETIRPEGQVTLCCDRRGKIHTIDFLVVNVPNQKPPLLSGRDAQALDYLKVYADEINAVKEEIPRNTQSLPPLGKLTKEDVLHNYSNVFRPGRGNPLGTPLHIDLDPNVTPVHASTRRVPVAKLDRVNDELKRLCDEGIIKPVTQPTDWLSNILVKEKPNGKLRICIDPSQTINMYKAIRRPKFTIPTIEEKLPQLTKTKVFTLSMYPKLFTPL
ncbi:uncharacterized protein LOC144664172 [Oculina patagonica]